MFLIEYEILQLFLQLEINEYVAMEHKELVRLCL